MKRIIPFIIIAAFVLSVLTGCDKFGKKPETTTDITDFGEQTEDQGGINASSFFSAYRAVNPAGRYELYIAEAQSISDGAALVCRGNEFKFIDDKGTELFK